MKISIPYIIIVVLLIALTVSVRSCKSEKTIKEDYKTIIEAKEGKIQLLELRNGRTLTKTEVENIVTKQGKELQLQQDSAINVFRKELGIKIKQINATQTTITNSTSNFNYLLKDSTIYDSVKIKVGVYKDKWFTLKQVIIGDSSFVTRESRDTIYQIESWKRKKILGFLPWGRKEYFVQLSNADTNNKIIYTKRVEFK